MLYLLATQPVALAQTTKPVLTIDLPRSVVADGVTEGESIRYQLLSTEYQELDVLVKVIDDTNNFIDPSDENQTVKFPRTTRIKSFYIPTLVSTGSRSGTVTIQIEPSENYTVGTQSQETIKINNNSVASGRPLVVESSSANEGEPLRFKFKIPNIVPSGEPDSSFMVSTVVTKGGGGCIATANEHDFEKGSETKLTFSRGKKELEILWVSKDDDRYELDEVVCLKVYNPVNLSLPSKPKFQPVLV